MQKHLHMSKKSSIFAPDLGIVLILTFNHNRVMMKELIFKCYARGKWWYVYGVDYGILGMRYRIYEGRKWYSHVTFETLQYAVCAAVNAVTCGMKGCSFLVEKEV